MSNEKGLSRINHCKLRHSHKALVKNWNKLFSKSPIAGPLLGFIEKNKMPLYTVTVEINERTLFHWK